MAIENVGYWHQAHSFVRGNWRNCDETSPMILQKCCHDMDLYLWLANKRCHSISSFGSNFYFNAAHAPAGATDRCTSGCSAKKECPFDAERIYLESPITGVCQGKTGWPCDVLTLHPDEKSIREAIETGPYGRCVFACDNNVVDHQVVNAQMTDGSTMSFTMCGLTTENTRYAKFMGTKGEIIANMHDNTIIISPFGKPSVTIDINKNQAAASGHGGGDFGLAQAFASLLNGSYTGTSLTSLDVSLESHYMALAAEQSRLCNGKSILISDMREPNK